MTPISIKIWRSHNYNHCRKKFRKLVYDKRHRQFILEFRMPMDNHIFTSYRVEAECAQYDAALDNQSLSSIPWSLYPHISNTIQEFPSCPIDLFADEYRASSSTKSHSQAEKRRRDRINAQLTALRKLIPKSEKMDKAALLGSVIAHVKCLKQKASEFSKDNTIPTEIDEVMIDSDTDEDAIPTEKNKNHIFIRASFCCDDRPELFHELLPLLDSLRLTTVKADISSVGGRIKSILILCCKERQEGVCLGTIKRSLKSVLNRIVSLSMESNCHIRSKRQRFFFPS